MIKINEAVLTKVFCLLIPLLLNFWIWKIFSQNFLVGFLLFTSTVLFYLYFNVGKKSLLYLGIGIFLVILVVQFKTTNKLDLFYLDNDQQRVQQQRIREYPLVYIPIGNKAIWLPVSKWFEESRYSIANSRIEQNLFEMLDPNLYFFSGSPRPRIGIKEYEKFPYLLLAFFIIGLFNIQKKDKYLLMGEFVLPIALLSYIGANNELGPFSLFPFIVLVSSFGIDAFYKFVKAHNLRKILFILLILYLITLVQLYAYEAF